MNVAVVGSGITGIGSAWALSQRHNVTLYESAARPGGHARTIDIEIGDRTLPVDTGFIVYNERNYPNLINLFHTLGVVTEDSDMSFAVSDPDSGIEYGGSVAGILANPSNVVRPRMWSILLGINEFRSEQGRLAAGQVPADLPIADYLAWRRYPKAFVSHYLLPLAAAVWSGAGDDVARMPAGTFLSFLNNHGLLRLNDRPQWRTVTSGSREYVSKAISAVDEVLLSTPVTAVDRSATEVTLTDGRGGKRRFDHVVFATHADTTLRILGDTATRDEKDILGSFRYAANRAIVHSDEGLMPANRSTWSSWNAIGSVAADASKPVTVTYWMNRLQSLPGDRQVFVSLNPSVEPRPGTVIDDVMFQHPQFDNHSERGHRDLGLIQGRERLWFAGAYCGYGFHEDGLQAGLTVAAQLGAPAPWASRITPRSPAATVALSRRVEKVA